MGALTITSPAFEENGHIPKQYTCDGKDASPPLVIDGIPRGAESLALIVDDPDAPVGTWVHWVLWNIDPAVKNIGENAVPPGAVQGKNDFKRTNYGGPCRRRVRTGISSRRMPLDIMLTIPPTSTKADLEKAMKGHILAEGADYRAV